MNLYIISELEEPVEHVVADLGPWPACLPSFRAAKYGSPFNIARNMNMRLSGGYAACAAKGSDQLRFWVSVVLSLV